MANQWLRLWHDMPNDPKWRTIARASAQPIPSVLAVFVHLLVEASANANERGRTQPNAEDIASALDVESGAVVKILEVMEGRVIQDGRLSGWSRRQPEREDGSADRARVWRENKAQQQPPLLPANATERTRTHANTDKKREEEKKQGAPKATPSAFEVPDWIARESWDAWMDMRRKKRVPNTDRALHTAVRKLDKLRAAGEDPAAVLDESTFRGWTGLFHVKGAVTTQATQVRTKTQYELDAEAQREERRQAKRELAAQ